MIIPVRCISCGRPISGKWEEYKKRISNGEKAKDVLDDLGVDSYCCRALFLTHRDVQGKIARYRV